MVVNELDNPVWYALIGPHALFATGVGQARRDAAPFSAIAEPSPAAYADLATDLLAGVEARLFRPGEEPTPDGWETISARPIIQMVFDRSTAPLHIGQSKHLRHVRGGQVHKLPSRLDLRPRLVEWRAFFARGLAPVDCTRRLSAVDDVPSPCKYQTFCTRSSLGRRNLRVSCPQTA